MVLASLHSNRTLTKIGEKKEGEKKQPGGVLVECLKTEPQLFQCSEFELEESIQHKDSKKDVPGQVSKLKMAWWY